MSGKHRLAAYKELWKHYREVFNYYWKRRHEMRTGMFSESEAEFLPAALAVQERPPSKTARLISWLLIALIVFAFCWAIFGHMDIVVNAAGKVIPSEYTKTIASVDTASVAALHVHEGQQVRAGETLIELNNEATEADRKKAQGELVEAVLQFARNQVLIDAVNARRAPRLPTIQALQTQYSTAIPPDKWEAANLHVQGQYADYQAKLAKLQNEIIGYESILPLITQQAINYRALAATHDVSHNAYLEKEQARKQMESQLRIARSQRESLIAETKRTAYDEMAQARRGINAARQDVQRYTAVADLYQLHSPIDGTVQQLSAHTIGGVVTAGQPIMQIVPVGGPVEVEAFIENKDRGFVHVGQTAAVKVDTFQYTKYGTLPGVVVHVSDDAIEDEKRGLIYAVRVRLDQNTLDVDGKPTPVTPGMSVNVEIKTGSRRIIEYVLSPLIRHTREALNER